MGVYPKCLSLAVVLLITGCATPTERAAKMSETAPRMTRHSDRGFRAHCPEHRTLTGLRGEWFGPLHKERADAWQDALDHNAMFAGHNAAIRVAE